MEAAHSSETLVSIYQTTVCHTLDEYNLQVNCIFILCRVFFLCVFLCIVFRLIVVLFCVMFVVCVLCLIVVQLPPGENPFAVKINM
jgi:predicted membrane protein